MATRICPMCKGIGKIEVETMNLQRIRNLLKDHINLHANHGLRHLDEKVIIKKCFKSILKLSGMVLEELEKEEPEPPKYFGNSSRQILRSHVKLAPRVNGPDFLFKYEDKIIENRRKGGVNLVREDIIDVERWGSLVARHTERFIEVGIKIIYTLADENKYGYGDYKKSCQFLKPYADHIFCGAENEIMDDDNIDEIIGRIKHIEDTGLVSLAGQWGWSHNGEEKSKELLEKYQPMIIGMARPYPPGRTFIAWIEYLKGFKRPIIEVEFLMDDAVQIEKYVRIGFDKGLYGFNNYAGDHLELMGRLCQELNQ